MRILCHSCYVHVTFVNSSSGSQFVQSISHLACSLSKTLHKHPQVSTMTHLAPPPYVSRAILLAPPLYIALSFALWSCTSVWTILTFCGHTPGPYDPSALGSHSNGPTPLPHPLISRAIHLSIATALVPLSQLFLSIT